MKRLILCFLLCLLSAGLLLAGCAKPNEPTESGPQTWSDYIGGDKLIAVQNGDTFEEYVKKEGWCQSPAIYQTFTEIIEAVRMGRVDVAILAEDIVAPLQESGIHDDLVFLPIPRDVLDLHTAPVFSNTALAEQFNTFLAQITEEGILEEIKQRYLYGLPDYEDIPKIELTGENGTLHAADTGDYPPMTYVGDNNELLGFHTEMIKRFAQYLGMDVQIDLMSYGGVLPAVVSGTVDMSACYYVITEEREQSAIFGNSVMSQGAVMVAKKQGSSESAAVDYTSFMGKRFSIMVGSIFDVIADDTFSASEKLYFNNTVEEIEAVKLGKTDAALLDDVAAAQALQAGEYDTLTAIPVPLPELDLPYGVFSLRQDIIDQYNTFLAEIEVDGTLEEMQQRWLKSYAFDAVMPDIPLSGENGTLTVAIMATYPPFTFLGANGEYAGFDIEQLSRFAAYLGMDVEFIDMDFGAMLSYVAAGKADMGGSVYATEERKQSFIFGNPDYVSKTVLVVRKADVGQSTTETERDYTWLNGKTIGKPIGYVVDEPLIEIGASLTEYTDAITGVEDVRNGRIDGFVTDLSIAKVLTAEKANQSMEVIEIPASYFTAPMGAIASFENQALIDEFNLFLADLSASGTLAEMQNRWLEEIPDVTTPMPELSYSGEKGVLRVAIVGTNVPFDYVGENNELKGYSVELMNRFASHTGYIIEYSAMEFGAQIAAVTGGKADMAISSISITEERKQSMLFTDSVYDDLLGVVVMKQDTTAPQRDYTWFAGKVVGAQIGGILDAVLEDFGAIPSYYTEKTSAIEDVRKGRVAGYITDLSILRLIAAEPGNANMEIIEIPASYFSAPMGAIASFENQALVNEFNAFLAVIKEDGTLGEMQNRWLSGTPDLAAPMPELSYSGEKGVLRVAIVGTHIPFDYMGENNEPKGYSVELMNRFAAYAGYTVEYSSMEFAGLIAAVLGDKVDFAISNISITEERKQSVLFTDSVYDDLLGIITLKEAETGAARFNFFEWLRSAIERNLLTENRWKLITQGLGVTMTISLLAQVLGTILGAVLCWVLLRKNRFVSGIGRLYSGLIYGLPIVVLLMISYYIIFGKTGVPAMLIAVCTFALVEAAAVAANLKGAIETVDQTEIEAARSMGFSSFGAFRAVTLPQAIKRALPAYCNGFIELVKATAIVGYIAIQDLTRAGDIIRSRTYDAYFPLLFVAIIYLIVTALCVQLFKLIVKKINKEVE